MTTWRVVLDGGEERPATVTETGVMRYAVHLAGLRVEVDASGERAALVVAAGACCGLPVVEILAPGQRSRAELTRELEALRETVRLAASAVARAASRVDFMFSGPVQDDAQDELDRCVDALVRTVESAALPPAAPLPPRAPAVRAPDGGGAGEGSPDAPEGATGALAGEGRL